MAKKLSKQEAWKRYCAAHQKMGPPAGNHKAAAEYLRLGLDYNFPPLDNKYNYPEEAPDPMFKPDGGFATKEDLLRFCLDNPNYSFADWGDDYQEAVRFLRDNSYSKAADFMEQVNALLDAFIRALEFLPPSICSAHRLPDPNCDTCRSMFQNTPQK